ncbi:hypothetical protein N431DRAFT_143496 [Stipitochalara longipes BDJ]|nr:hypothetical protein N431DRAFT_143496 [Stipitochalara longipes BDJ]
MTTLRVDSGIRQWFGYQLIAGIGTGMTLQQCSIAAQTVLAKKDITIELTIIGFAQFLASTISLSISQTTLANTLTTQLSKNLPGVRCISGCQRESHPTGRARIERTLTDCTHGV